jgi:hypothetical protein
MATQTGDAALTELSRGVLGEPAAPTIATPFEATTHNHASVPAITFGHLTHVLSANTLWDVRVGRFEFMRSVRPARAI